MGLTLANFAAALLLQTLQAARAESFLSCDPTVLGTCPGNDQICIAATGHCVCKEGLTPVGEDCVAASDSHGGTIAVAVLFTLALLIGGLILVVRKYNLVEYVRQKINLRRGNDVMYEDVMIGQDDPPLSP